MYDAVALGDNSVKLYSIGYCDIGILKNVMIVPKMTCNLISGSCLDVLGYALLLKDQRCQIIKDNIVIVSGPLTRGLYHTDLGHFLPRINNIACTTSSKGSQSSNRATGVFKKQSTIATAADIELMHKRMGHADVTSILEGLKTGTVTGYEVTAKRVKSKWVLNNGLCKHCMLGKSKLPAFPRASTAKGKDRGDYLVTDIMGPFAVETLQGETYALTNTDWYSRYSWTYLLKRKSDALTCLKHLLEVVFPAAQVLLRHYHTDNAGELSGRETIDYLERTVHATHSTSEPYTPQRNAIAERNFRTLGEMTATMLHESGLPRTMWGYAFEAATYIRNRIPSVRVDGLLKSPYELWTNKVPCICH
jgi:transposase InsO family protein